MSDLSVHNAPKGIAVIPFYGTASLFFILLSILLCFSATEITGHYFNPHILAIVHASVLGWGTMVILGAAYQLLPVICEKELYSSSLAFISYLLLTIGTVILVYCFWHFATNNWMIAGGTCVVISSYLYFINVWATAKDTETDSLSSYFLISSAFWFCFTTTVGLLLAINLQYTFIPRNHMDILKLHAHAGFVGWFMQLITGVGAKMIPMFLLGKSKKKWLLYASLMLQNLGLILFLADGYYNPIQLRMITYALIIGLSIGCWLIFMIDVYKNRVRKKVEILMRFSGISILFLGLSFTLIPLILTHNQNKWSALYGTWILLGWITSIILGMTFKTLPFIIWNNRYKNLHGKAKIPMPKQLYKAEVIRYQYYLYLAAILSMTAGIIVNNSIILSVSGWIWVVIAILYGYNVFRIIFHKKYIHHEHITD